MFDRNRLSIPPIAKGLGQLMSSALEFGAEAKFYSVDGEMIVVEVVS